MTDLSAIIVRDRLGNPVEHIGVGRIRAHTADGGTQEYSACSITEATVNLDFSNGDMVVTPEHGTLLEKVNIQKPVDLIPENIADGVDIAGVTGSLKNETGGVKSKAINFYDVYGDIVYSYTRAQAAALTELPEVPELEGYEVRGWNKTLNTIKDTAAFADVGARYSKNGIPVCISVIDIVNRSLTLNLHFKSYVSGTTATNVTVYWGDGTNTALTMTAANKTYSATHTYTTTGKRIVGIAYEDLSYLYLGSYISSTGASVGGYQFIDATFTKNQLLSCSGGAAAGNDAFYQNQHLKYLDINVNNSYFACYKCYRLEVNANGSPGLPIKWSAYQYNYALKRVSGNAGNSKLFSYSVIDDIVCNSGSNVYFKEGYYTRVIILGTTPGYLDGFSYPSTLEGIYVPDSAVSAYKSNSYWSPYASYIKPLSQYPDY